MRSFLMDNEVEQLSNAIRSFLKSTPTHLKAGDDFGDSILRTFRDHQNTLIPTIEQINLSDLISPILRRMTPAFGNKSIQISHEMSPSQIVWGMDSLLISKVFSNLLSHALKCTAPGGWIHIDIRVMNGRCNFYISDTGYVLSDEDLQNLFRNSSDVHAEHNTERYGLDLWLCKQIVESHHGEISALKNAEIGMTFRFSLPYAG